MPIRKEMADQYPPDWHDIAKRIKERDGWRCKFCNVPQYAVGWRDDDGQFHRLCGSGPCDAAGQGLAWPSMERIEYREACEFRDSANEWTDGERYLVIVLTTAHLHDPDPANCDPENLAALCQRCHNKYDAKARAAGVKQRKEASSQQMDLFKID